MVLLNGHTEDDESNTLSCKQLYTHKAGCMKTISPIVQCAFLGQYSSPHQLHYKHYLKAFIQSTATHNHMYIPQHHIHSVTVDM